MSVRLVESQRVPRKGLAVDDFAQKRSVEDALALLAIPGHTRHEFLSSRVDTRLYLDYDEVLESPLTPEILKDRKDKVVARLDALLGPFSEDKTIVYYSIASRHGFSPRHGKFKVSFRPFVRGLSIPYTEIPLLLRSMQQDDFWDLSVYKEGEQLLAAINGVKDRDDPRVLTKEHADDPDAWYVAQILDDNALPFHMPLELGQSTTSSLSSLSTSYTTSLTSSTSSTSSTLRESNVDAVLVRDVLACLRSERFRDYASWRTVGFALKSLGDDVYLQEFQEFSRIPEYDSTEAQKACRELFERASTNGVTFGTLRHWAKEDDAEGYQRACAAYKMRSESSIVDRVTYDKILDAARILYTKLTSTQTAPITSVLRHDVSKAVFDVHVLLDDATEGHMTMALDTLHVRGVFHVGTFEKYLNDSEATAIPVVGVEIASVHKDLPPDLQWRIMRPTGTRAVFSTESNRAMIEVLNVNSPGKETANVKYDLKTAAIKKGQLSLLNDAYKRAIENAVVNDMNMGWAINIGIGTVNIYNSEVQGDADAGRHTDEELVASLLAAHPTLLGSVKFAPRAKTDNCNGLFHCDPATNIWTQRHNMYFEAMLVGLFARMDEGNVNDRDRRHIESRRGRFDVLYGLASRALDERFLERLDANPDLFALTNGCFDFSSSSGEPVFRPLTPEDAVSAPAKWDYCTARAAEHRADLERFLAQLFPIAEERRLVLAYFASLMTGHRYAKKFLVLTDRRSGNNGKSSLLLLLEMFFGENYCQRSTKFVCRGDRAADRNAHDAGTEPFRGARLVLAEELKKHMALDDAMLKQLTGGAGVTVAGRRFGSVERYAFLWQAGIVLVFNEGDCPQFDASDAAFLERMMVAPMRSKFVEPGELSGDTAGEPWTFAREHDIGKRFPLWLPALAEVLMDHRLHPDEFSRLPADMRDWRNGLSADANPLAEWLEQNVEVTGDREDHLLVADLKRLYPGSAKNFAAMAKAFFQIRAGGAEFKDEAKVRLPDGRRKSERNVVRGVRMSSG